MKTFKMSAEERKIVAMAEMEKVLRKAGAKDDQIRDVIYAGLDFLHFYLNAEGYVKKGKKK